MLFIKCNTQFTNLQLIYSSYKHLIANYYFKNIKNLAPNNQNVINTLFVSKTVKYE